MVEFLDTRLQDREIASRFESIFGQKLCMYIWYLVPSPLHHHNMHTFSSLGMRWLASDEIKRKQVVVLHGLAPMAECCRTNTNISSRFLVGEHGLAEASFLRNTSAWGYSQRYNYVYVKEMYMCIYIPTRFSRTLAESIILLLLPQLC